MTSVVEYQYRVLTDAKLGWLLPIGTPQPMPCQGLPNAFSDDANSWLFSTLQYFSALSMQCTTSRLK